MTSDFAGIAAHPMGKVNAPKRMAIAIGGSLESVLDDGHPELITVLSLAAGSGAMSCVTDGLAKNKSGVFTFEWTARIVRGRPEPQRFGGECDDLVVILQSGRSWLSVG